MIISTGRRRHAYRKVFPIIVGTYMIMSAILIPMGFMFMSTLGGKALLVSKMALMVSLMSNIKKIFSYEYYVPPAPPAGHHHWKRTLLAHRTTASPLYSSYTAYWNCNITTNIYNQISNNLYRNRPIWNSILRNILINRYYLCLEKSLCL